MTRHPSAGQVYGCSSSALNGLNLKTYFKISTIPLIPLIFREYSSWDIQQNSTFICVILRRYTFKIFLNFWHTSLLLKIAKLAIGYWKSELLVLLNKRFYFALRPHLSKNYFRYCMQFNKSQFKSTVFLWLKWVSLFCTHYPVPFS